MLWAAGVVAVLAVACHIARVPRRMTEGTLVAMLALAIVHSHKVLAVAVLAVVVVMAAVLMGRL